MEPERWAIGGVAPPFHRGNFGHIRIDRAHLTHSPSLYAVIKSQAAVIRFVKDAPGQGTPTQEHRGGHTGRPV